MFELYGLSINHGDPALEQAEERLEGVLVRSQRSGSWVEAEGRL
jgi:hypothetical protein